MNTEHLEYLVTQLVANGGVLKERIATASETNTKKMKLYDKYSETNSKRASLADRYMQLKLLNSMIMRILDHRRDTILKEVSERTEAILAVIIPEENFKILITYEPSGKDYVSEVLVGKALESGEIHWSHPKGTNGEFIKQLISFSMLVSINTLLGSNFLFMDEPFSSSDVVNVGKMKPIIELMLKQDLQLMFIEHKPELYENVPHNLIKLMKHRSENIGNGGFVEVLFNGTVNAMENEEAEESNA